jgi:hypothetical protein
MENESHDNTVNWKNKLDGLECLPGEEATDKDALWDKLDARRGKRNNKKALWYWMAAACLLFILLIPFFHKEKNQSINNGIVQKQPVQSTSRPSQVIIKEEPKTLTVLEPAKRESTDFISNKVHNRSLLIPETNRKLLQVAGTVSIQATLTPGTTDLIAAGNSISVVTQIPAKKKLKVVHINELGDDVEQSPDVARNADIHSFQFKFGNGEAYMNASRTSKATEYSFLKTKTSPN